VSAVSVDTCLEGDKGVQYRRSLLRKGASTYTFDTVSTHAKLNFYSYSTLVSYIRVICTWPIILVENVGFLQFLVITILSIYCSYSEYVKLYQLEQF